MMNLSQLLPGYFSIIIPFFCVISVINMAKQSLLIVNRSARKTMASLLMLGISVPGYAEQHDEELEESRRAESSASLVYRNPQERREAGLGTWITDWLKFSGLLETEKQFSQLRFENNVDDSEAEPTTVTVQAALYARINDWLEADMVFEVEHDGNAHSRLDEGEINAELDDWGLKIGLLYLPFGEYYSYFVTGPMLEFGETRKNTVLIDYSFTDTIELAIFGFNSKVEQESSDNQLDWGLSFEITTENESVRFGTSYISDLAETEEALLGTNTSTYGHLVPGWSAYLLLGFKHMEMTLETVQALREFEELPDNANKPAATNIELAYFLRQDLQVALRVAHSTELLSQPEKQYGVAAAWRIFENTTLSADYIHGIFKDGFYFDENGFELKSVDQYAIQLSMEF